MTADISIHALREEGDFCSSWASTRNRDFYPRPPRGGRPEQPTPEESWISQFLSTPSARRATSASLPCRSPARFLSTPSARRATLQHQHWRRDRHDFYPRPPRGGRRQVRVQRVRMDRFLSTPSARRATKTPTSQGPRRSHFYPRPPRGGRPPSRNHSHLV